MTGPGPGASDFAGKTVLVAGAGVSGLATVHALLAVGASVVVADSREHALGPAITLGARGLLLDTEAAAVPSSQVFEGVSLVITSPGWRPEAPLLTAAAKYGIPVWGDVELAWRLDQAGVFGPPRRWLAVTGTNGKTTTTSMLHSILRAAGLASAACGNIGRPILDALMAGSGEAPGPRIDVLALELSSFQLYWAPSVTPDAGVILNIAEDHLDWHGSMDAYVEAKLRVLTGRLGVLGLDDAVTSQLGARSRAARTIGFRLGAPEPNELGIVGDYLVDRAFSSAGDTTGVRLARVDEVRPGGRPGLLDALAAAALARGIGVSSEAVADGLRTHETGPHRNSRVAELAGVAYVDDSKATNPHAALASLSTYPRVVWIAGGLLKGARVDDLVLGARERLAAAVVIGADRSVIAETLQRHAPDVPVVEVFAGDDGGVTVTTIQSGRAGTHLAASSSQQVQGGKATADAVMKAAVTVAAQLAHAGDTVLLAPSAASLDMFTDYGHRGRSFTDAVAALGSPPLRGAKGVTD
ncbi:UDP-N-acetylmuramoyl-L-alanine--D-glutamate ligase [Hoyosella sp. YIM 151337]|uniref:UDP-N-acetylmuramoyl-L-alanine--D-glutamate ligase n=1 Tax=Hoyosella sp. YIM 151337 TaxID=2992742 RepID=UPI00223579FE|nr:UDP-N-acetylmuramoyl-L-alanine--D-glutamate ligase [Hoyosella sp. YIM 151337]MCW4355424.1 UDP-N-acetylmuramoyl-L-alanine--D-glutamate ligase [Hoyosella sp. YIM 151337]